MAREVKRRTPRCDANGNLLDQYRGLFDLRALAEARKAGIPERLLDKRGWDGDENDLTGFYADQIYSLGMLMADVVLDLDRVQVPISWMERICDQYGVDRKAAIPYDGARFLRQMKEAQDRQESIARGDELPLVSEADVSWGVW